MKSKAFSDVISGGALLVDEELESQLEPEGATVTWSLGSRKLLPRNPGQAKFQSFESGRTILQERYGLPPRILHLRNLADDRLRLTAPLPVVLQYGEESVTACSYDLEDFGVGATEFDALADLRATLVELYFSLKQDRDRLGWQPRREWAFLRSIIQES
jgi:hypothetical protein